MRRAKQAVKQVLLCSDPDLVQYQRVNDSSGSNGQSSASKSSPLRTRNEQASMPPPMVDEQVLQARLLESLVSASAARPARNAIFKLHQSFVNNQEVGSANREGSSQRDLSAIESTTAASLSTNSAVELLARATLARSLGGHPSSTNGRALGNAAPCPPPSGPTQALSSSSSSNPLSQSGKPGANNNGWPAAGDKPDPLRPMELARRAWERCSVFFLISLFEHVEPFRCRLSPA